MNLRTFSAISAVSMLVLGGCVIVGNNPSGGAGGTGGNGTGGEVTTGGAGGTSSSANVGGGGGAGGGAAACAKTCAEAVTDGVAVCESSPASKALYDALATCSCMRAAMDPMPGCKDVCDANLCTGGSPDADCSKCVQTGSCATEFGACSGDL